MLFRRIILFARRLRSTNRASVTATEDDASDVKDDGDDVAGILAPFTFVDIILSTTMNSTSETIDTIEKINTGIRPDIGDDDNDNECMFTKNESAIRNEIIVIDRVIAPLMSIFFSILVPLLLFLYLCMEDSTPTGMVWPEKAVGTLATEAIRAEGGILLNSKGERFMKNYYPERMELGPRDVVARAVYSEIVAGRGTEHSGVWLDVTHLSKEKILDRLPTMYEQFRDLAGIDISKQKMEVAPTAHYSMGGVVVDLNCRTKIRNLFAVGEVISQIHGANRLGGNSLLDTVVFGKIAGSHAGEISKGKRENFTTISNTKELK